jgi:hypothetical protein
MKKSLKPLLSGLCILILSACSSGYDSVNLASKKVKSACFGESCGACSRLVASTSVPVNAENRAEHQSLDFYLNSDGSIKYPLDVTYGGFWMAFFPLVLNDDWGLTGTSGNHLSRQADLVNNYMLIRANTSITLPQEPEGAFYREYIEGFPFRFVLTTDSAFEVKKINADGTRTILMTQNQRQSVGSKLFCLPGIYTLNGTSSVDFEFDWAIAKGDVSSPPVNSTFALSFTSNMDSSAMDLCNQTIWVPEDPERPESGPNRGYSGDDLISFGIIGIPKELYQTTSESRAQNSELRTCSLSE